LTQRQLLSNPQSDDSMIQGHALPYGLMMRRRGFAFRFLDKSPNGRPTLGTVEFTEPPEYVRHLSHALKARAIKRLVRN